MQSNQFTFRVVFKRNPPGDRWMYTYDDNEPKYNAGEVFPTLTSALEDFYQKTGHTEYYINAAAGMVFAVDEVQQVTPPTPVVPKFSIYGDA